MADREKVLEEMNAEIAGEKSAGGFITGLLFGAVLGAGIALLLAPDSGRHTRRQLGRRLRSLRAEATRGLERAEARARRQLRRRRRSLRERFLD